MLDGAGAIVAVQALTQQALVSINSIAIAAKQKNRVGVKAAYGSLKSAIDSAARHFDARMTAVDIFFSPMPPAFTPEQHQTPCARCGMDLLTRRIPYSFIYTNNVAGRPWDSCSMRPRRDL